MVSSVWTQWFGLASSAQSSSRQSQSPDAQAPAHNSQTQPQRALAIAPSPSSPSSRPQSPLRKTRSDELLSDFDAMRFLARMDGALRERTPLCDEDAARLEALYIQACADGSEVLQDIIEHLERCAARGAGGAGPSRVVGQSCHAHSAPPPVTNVVAQSP
jgi:hypothetical protein